MLNTPRASPVQPSHLSHSSPPLSTHTDSRSRPDRFCDAPPIPFSLLQLNCHVSEAVTLSVPNEGLFADVLILQEPWVNPFDFSPPPHPAWRAFTAFEHAPKEWSDRHKAVIFVKKTIPTTSAFLLPGGSQCLVIVGFDLPEASFRIVNVYNPTPSFSSIPRLTDWLSSHNDRSIPTLICIDSNLHHPHWDPTSCGKK